MKSKITNDLIKASAIEILQTKLPFNSTDVKSKLHLKFGQSISRARIIDYKKSQLNLNYKFSVNHLKLIGVFLKLKWTIFVSRFCWDISCDDLLINVDVWSVYRHTRPGNLWNLKENDTEWRSIKFLMQHH